MFFQQTLYLCQSFWHAQQSASKHTDTNSYNINIVMVKFLHCLKTFAAKSNATSMTVGAITGEETQRA
jgi:hypothetical protein